MYEINTDKIKIDIILDLELFIYYKDTAYIQTHYSWHISFIIVKKKYE